MGFSKKATQGGSGGSSDYDAEAWGTWNKYLHEQFPLKKSTKKGTKDRKQKNLLGVVGYIQDLGFPPAPDNMWKVKDDWVAPEEGQDYSQYEIDFMKEHPEADFVWDKEWDDTQKKMVTRRKQTSPAQAQQEYGICVDFPQWLVDFSKHPNAPEDAPEDLRPMRVSLNGRFRGEIQRPITFETNWKTGEVTDKNIIRKICIAAGLDEELVSSGFDIGTVAEAICNFKVTSDLNVDGDKVFYNTAASSPTAIEDIEFDGEIVATIDQQIEKIKSVEGLAPFTGVLLDMGMSEYTDELLEMVHSTGSAHAFIKRAELSKEIEISGTKKDGTEYSFTKGVDYDSTNFAKAYNAWLKKKDKEISKGESKGNSGNSKPTVDAKADGKPEKVATPKPSNEPPMDWDEDIPF
ncbi:hypothetical protein VPHG_00090 [Vibrio phage 11895-B1]|uniref:hypothetical protein n=1 Tax=Vibrio phage 11895-B1 TaxID=754075 RepID=UPI0002C063F0|nr:hypothetical protein VPHG_00090 [Vibrio phage 11895-B1]AGH32157.1 hypothetical protein VPHG_00090 [Vibrio phage 11895-B1]